MLIGQNGEQNGFGVERSLQREEPLHLTFSLSLIATGRFWQLATDALPPQDAKNLEEDLGVEKDTPEHIALEQGSLCQQPRGNPLKRKRL